MKAQVKLGRIAGISIGLHYSWFIIALLIALSLVQHFRAVTPQWSSTVIWIAALVTSLLFFAALLLHELAHSLVAKTRGLRVRSITLFALGGVSQIETEASDAKSEFWIAIVGPLTSLVIGLVLLGSAWVNGWKTGTEPATPVISVLVWLGYINITLAGLSAGRRACLACRNLVDHRQCRPLDKSRRPGRPSRRFSIHLIGLISILRRRELRRTLVSVYRLVPA
jgi:Zn-dependent protease